MRISTKGVFLVLSLGLTMPFAALARDASCDMSATDAAKMSPEEKQAMHDKCGAQMRDENCGIAGVDMSMMSADDQKIMKETCVAKMKRMGCDMKGMNKSKMSAQDTQKMMDQCHAKLVDTAPKPTSAPAKAD